MHASAEEFTGETLKDGLSVDEFLSRPFMSTRPEPDLLPRAQGGFLTPSGKFEFFCEKMERDGLDPLRPLSLPTRL